MKKLFYILASIVLVSCEVPEHKQNHDGVRGLQLVGHITDHWILKTYHDDLRDNTCYIAVPQYDSDSATMSCVKDTQPAY